LHQPNMRNRAMKFETGQPEKNYSRHTAGAAKPVEKRPVESLEGELSPSGTRRSGNVGKASQGSQVASDELAKMRRLLDD